MSFAAKEGPSAEVFTWGDQYLDLYGGEWREHNRFYLPSNAWAISFCRKVFDVGSSDVLSIYLQVHGLYREIYSEELAGAGDWECFAIPLLWDERNEPVTLFLMLSDLLGADPNVGVDDISIVTGLFFDAFESGDTSRWGSANGL